MTDGLLSQSFTSAAADTDRSVDPDLVARARAMAAKGTVLLRNENDVLPFAAGTRLALFGRIQKDWIAVGYGSGGDVNPPYVTNLLDSLRESGRVEVDLQLAQQYEAWCEQNPADPGEHWGAWPRHYPEMPLDDDAVREAAGRNEAAVVVIGRAAGEDRDAELAGGSYYLTDAEHALLSQVTGAFDRTVVIVDGGNVIDLSWTENYPLDGVMIAWAGGMEGGRATADVLTGAVEPGGRLTATFARRYQDYPSAGHFGDADVTAYVEDVFVGYRYFETFAPEKVLFPFGSGLGYTRFDIEPAGVHADERTILVRARVTNTGDRPGDEAVQVYVHKPSVELSQPLRALAAFGRTGELAPGESREMELPIAWADLASYDDAGATGHRSAYVLEAGSYRFHVGHDVRSAHDADGVDITELRVVQQLKEAAAVDPAHGFERIVLEYDDNGDPRIGYAPVPTRTTSLKQRILDRLPEAVDPPVGDAPTFEEVLEGTAGLDDFIATLTPRELADLTYGDVTMDSPLGAAGNAGALGGVSRALRDRGVIPAITTDGPSGIRLSTHASLLPCGTALASTWDPQAVQELCARHGQEMSRKGSDILLGPGMNIQRDPLCGRNFEYFSEDPLVSGLTGAAQVNGIQSQGLAACPKHFACNNQEFKRSQVDVRVSERALREIYLRGFELMVRESSPWAIMTSYNKINGVWGHYHYDLITSILRGEWGFTGLVMTDWWMRMAQDPDFPALHDSGYRVRAGVDVLMPGSIHSQQPVRDEGVLESHRAQDGLTLGEMQEAARHVLGYLAAVRPQGHRMGRGEREEH